MPHRNRPRILCAAWRLLATLLASLTLMPSGAYSLPGLAVDGITTESRAIKAQFSFNRGYGGSGSVGRGMGSSMGDGYRSPSGPRVRIPFPIVTVPLKEPVAGLSCEGGSTRGGSCVCGSGEKRRQVGKRAYVCEASKPKKDKPKVEVATIPNGPACEGGKVRRGHCTCPKGERLSYGVCKGADRPPTIIVNPGGGGGAPLPPEPDDPPAAPAQAPVQAAGALPTSRPDEILVTLPIGFDQAIEETVAQAYGLELVERQTIALINARVVLYRIPDGRSVPSVIAQLSTDPRVGEPQPNHVYRASGGTVSASAELQYALAKLEAPAANSIATGRDILVAVIDSSIDAGHPDLARTVVERFDATGASPKADAHGTAIAGIISAGGMVRGIAPGARLLGVTTFVSNSREAAPETSTLILLKGLDWSIAHGARVLNLSFAGPRDELVHKALRAALDRRAVAVAAAGNGGPSAPPAFPAAYEEVIAVTAVDAIDGLYAKANRGSYIAIAAPGVDVLVASTGSGHDLKSGTSFAAAYVSGIVALMLERNPGLTAAAVRHTLTLSAFDLGRPGFDPEFGAGRANAAASVRAVSEMTAERKDPAIQPVSTRP
jgi:subtilisin family serine protease